jgi:hypothetical protein
LSPDYRHALKEYLKKPWFAYIIVVITILATMLVPSVFAYLMLIISIFVLSDISANLVVRGGKRIAQIRVLRTTQTQPEGYFFCAFFISIVITSVAIDLASQAITSFAVSLLSDMFYAIIVALALGLAVYIDMRLRYYVRG